MASSIPHSQTVAVLNKLNPSKLTGAQKSRVARLLANPATRHLLADRFLTPAQQQTRTVNTRLAQPVVPGSSVTNRDLASQRNEATALKYGTAESEANRNVASRQAAVGQTGGYFDNYLAELRAHEANQAQINAQSQAAVQGLAGSVQGLAQNDAGVVSQGNQSLQAATGASPASVTQDASNASMLRQALTASFGAMLAGQGANASSYADTLAHVVGPGQKLQGLTRAQGDVTKASQARSDLAKEKGSFEQQFENEFRTNEAKNVLAGQIAGVKSAQEQQKIDIAAKSLNVNAKSKAATAAENARHHKASEANTHRATTVSARNAKTRQDAQGRAIYDHGPFAGRSKSDIQGMSESRRQQLVDAYNKKHPAGGKPPDPATQAAKDFYAKYGVKPLSTEQHNSAKNQITQIQSWFDRLGGASGSNGQLLTTGQAAAKVNGKPQPAVPKFPAVLVRAAMEIKKLGGITAATANRLHHAGYSVGTLGLKMAPKPPPASAGQLIPGVGVAG